MHHFLAMTLFAALVSPAFACLMREGVSERLRFGLFTFAALMGSGLGVGWLLYLLYR